MRTGNNTGLHIPDGGARKPKTEAKDVQVDAQKVKQLLSREESEKLDFKACLKLSTESEKKELVKDVTAIANSKGGRGHIIFGIEDKTKRVIGIDKTSFQEEQIQQIIYNRSDPPVPVQVDFVEYEGKLLAVITIFKSRHAPHQLIQNGCFYIRRGSTTDYLRRAELASILQENGLLSFETVIRTDVGLDALDTSRIQSFFAGMQIMGDHPNEILMETFGFIGDRGNGEYSPTIGGLLLFGLNLQAIMPHSHIKLIHDQHVEMKTDNIPNLLDWVSKRIRELMDDADYPFEALEEAVANALVHRDYLDSSRGIIVNLRKKSIEITNPGAYFGGNRVYGYNKDDFPLRRNPWLYQRLVLVDEKKRFLKYGLGINNIKRSFEGIGKVKFVNLGRSNAFRVVLPRII